MCANPSDEAPDDATFNGGMCLDGGCPDALCGTGDTFVARWIETVLMSLFSTFFVSQPASVAFKAAVMPAVARWCV